MRLLDSRRLTGPNLLSHAPLALAEVAFDAGEPADRGAELWATEAARLCARVGLEFSAPIIRHSRKCSLLAFAAQIDVLLAATDVNDWAVASAAALVAGGAPLEVASAAVELRAKLELARNPGLLSLQHEARARGVPFLWDDQLVSLGHGARSRSFAPSALPPLASIDWPSLGRVPIALITGTNGKTTSARLLARIARLAGLRAGLASTDAIAVDGHVLDRGDFTGPMAARSVLRHPDVQVAVLETARGGILRRGLAVEEADAALLTNVEDDHLGEYGIDTIEQLAEAKAVTGRAVVPSGRVVLNADDPRLLHLAPSFRAPITLFSLDAASPAIALHVARGGEAFALRGEDLVHLSPGGERRLIGAAEVALSFAGAARFNLANALGALGLASALRLPESAALEALRTFKPDAVDNPGRANLVNVGGVSVLIDFGHNPHGVRAVAGLLAGLRKGRARGRLLVISGAAGDRSDESLRALAAELVALSPERVYLRELADYLRGRALGETTQLLRAELLRLGVQESGALIAESEAAALDSALDEARPGDFVVLLVHLDEEEVKAVIDRRRV